MLLPKCSPKQLTWVFIFLSTTVLINLWYMTRVVDISFFFTQFQNLSLFQQLTYTKHILLWNNFEELTGLDIQCPDYNCIFNVRTPDLETEDLFLYTILFDKEVLNSTDRPKTRWGHQIYVFWSLVPPDKAPACGELNDNFFNWTFTYRLDSTLIWNHFAVQHLNSGKIVTPDEWVKWEVSHDPLKADVKSMLNRKTKAIAWVKTDCKNHPGDSYLTALQSHIAKMGLSFNVFDECSEQETVENHNIIKEEEYYFLIAFEDYIAKDYVTDKILRAYDNYVVPIVYGGANYSWFLPPGSYLDASNSSPFTLAYTIKKALRKPSVYQSFFNWTNVYNISAYPDGTHPLCNLCSALNNRKRENVVDFRRWWNTQEGLKACNKSNNTLSTSE